LLEASSLSYVAFELYFAAVVLIPLLTFSVVSDEREGGRYKLLRSLPVSPIKIIIGKIAGALGVVSIPLLLLILMPLVLSPFGEISFSTSYAAILYLLGFCAAYTAVGVMMSAIFKNKVFTLVFTYLAGAVMFSLESFVSDHLYMLLFGMFDLSVVIYHASVVILSLLITSRLFMRDSFGRR
jgi:ABC-2 type transport system permease protein